MPNYTMENWKINKVLYRDLSLIKNISPLATLAHSGWRPNTPSFPVHHQLRELAQTHVHWVSDAIRPSHPLLSSDPPALNLSQHQSLFRWVRSSHQVATCLRLHNWYTEAQTGYETCLSSHNSHVEARRGLTTCLRSHSSDMEAQRG